MTVWRAAHALACDVFLLTRHLAPRDAFTLGDQLRRASLSIPANVAEGCGRNGDRELGRFIDIALGSANELHCLLEIGRDTGITQPSMADGLMARTTEVQRMLAALRRATRAPPGASPRPAGTPAGAVPDDARAPGGHRALSEGMSVEAGAIRPSPNGDS